MKAHKAETPSSQSSALADRREISIFAKHKALAELVPAQKTRFPLGIAKGDLLVPKGDRWWQPMTDEEAEAWAGSQ